MLSLGYHEVRDCEHEEGAMRHQVIWTFYLTTGRNATTKEESLVAVRCWMQLTT